MLPRGYYLGSGSFSDPLRRRILGTAVPSSGAWQQGDKVENRALTLGGVASWGCVADGSQGTWHPIGIVGAIQATSVAALATISGGESPTEAEFNAVVAKINELITVWKTSKQMAT